MNKGLVYKTTGSWYAVRDANGRMWKARIKGKLKIDDEISSTNPIAVGDLVSFQEEDETANTAIISDVLQRENYIVRVSPHNKHQKHIVASNLDLAILVATLAEPRTSQGFVDRFLLTAEMYHIPAVLVLNKTDRLSESAKETARHWTEMYEAAGYKVFHTAALQKDTVAPIQELLQGRTGLFSGHSGVGKSTLINALLPNQNLRTGAVSGWSGKGQHTTTFAEMFDGPDASRIIDTPGVKEFGLINIERDELGHYFPEIKREMEGCRFNNCMHLDEPGCAVKDAVAAEKLDEARYVSYCNILEDLGNHRRR
jgi:ribosome biogenesis GTPase